ncbi:DUF4123 domain-containing protein [Chromobacterium sp. CV08]|uniref:DUF4123 domain-containing protein n=1 Tax=Chromobacterium sp. CV08 TaxID=3133274 RepID=UPI003DA9C5CC
MTPAIVMRAASPEAWLALLLQGARELGLSSLDLIVDQAGIGSRWQRRLDTQHPPLALLQATPHADAADEGPVLVRLPVQQSQLRLLKLLRQWRGQPRVLALLGDWPFDVLAQRLTLCLQASWDKGLQQGVLRYHDPRLFAAVVDALDEPRRQLLLEPAAQWHWLDRDGHARMLDAAALRAQPPLAWPEETMPLDQRHIDALSSWHLAETWRRDYLLTPAMYGLDSEEELMRRLARAHQAADKARLWSEPERMPLVESLLQEGVG